MDFSYLQTCEGITSADIESALLSDRNTQAFLTRIAAIAKPNSGAGKILYFFAKLAVSDQLKPQREDEYETLSIQVLQDRREEGCFIIRMISAAGLDSSVLFKVVIHCEFSELLEAARDTKNMLPFSCTGAHENSLFLEATGEARRTSLLPPASAEVDENIDFFGAQLPWSDRMLEAKEMGLPLSSLTLKPGYRGLQEREPPSGLEHALIEPPPVRKRFESWSEEAETLAKQPASIPASVQTPIKEDSVRQSQAAVIGRLALKRIPSREINPLAARPKTERPPGIDEEEVDAPSLPPLPLVGAKVSHRKEDEGEGLAIETEEIDGKW